MTRTLATIKITAAYDTARIGGSSIGSSTDITRVETGNQAVGENNRYCL